MTIARRLIAFVTALACTGLFITRAEAADYFLEGVPASVTLIDEVNNGGSGQILEIVMKEGYTGNWCAGNIAYGGPGAADIPMGSTALFADMVRQAQTALVAGKRLRIRSHTTTSSLSSCRVHYMQMK